ncbi:Uncharacterized protein PRO82_000907 [Candidatus Protochlamydia amoebophila]|nr:Uncharacterized protein [Candidatus Protochlamydia amoebophila]
MRAKMNHPNYDNQKPVSFKKQHSEIDQLAEFILDSLEESHQSEWEPFEVYAKKLRSHIYADQRVFRQQFTKGYESLLEVLSHRHSS